MKVNLMIVVVVLFLITFMGSSGFSAYINWKNAKTISDIYQMQEDKIDATTLQLEKNYDSVKALVKIRESKISTLEKSLYRSIQKANQNNKKYEKLKQDALAITNADSLARSLSRRYKKR